MTAQPAFAQGEALPAIMSAPVTMARVADYAAASGDMNPIHLDPAVARQAGFEAPIVHGMLLAALIHEAARRWASDGRVIGQRTQFLAPVPVGVSLAVTGRVVKRAVVDGAHHAIVRAMITRDDRKPAVMAEIDILLAPSAAGHAP